jgi:hypothetical protein
MRRVSGELESKVNVERREKEFSGISFGRAGRSIS